MCSCFSITSSWYTLPVRSRGGSSLQGRGGVRISAHSWEEPGLQAPLVPEALGVLSWLEYQGCLVGEGLHCLGRAPHLVGLGSTRPEVSGSPPTRGPSMRFQEKFLEFLELYTRGQHSTKPLPHTHPCSTEQALARSWHSGVCK